MRSEPKAERRFVEFRAAENGLSGIVLRYGDRAKFGRFTERFEPGALRFDGDVTANLMHDRSKPVARTGAGLTLGESGGVIEARIDWPDTVYAREAKELVEARILRGLSVEFVPEMQRMEGMERVISRARMTGLGIVDRPAYKESQIMQRFEELAAAPAATPRRKLL